MADKLKLTSLIDKKQIEVYCELCIAFSKIGDMESTVDVR